VIFVRDNGVGFDMAAWTKLFGVFQRLAFARGVRGHGRGSRECPRIIARHGGKHLGGQRKPALGGFLLLALPHLSKKAPNETTHHNPPERRAGC